MQIIAIVPPDERQSHPVFIRFRANLPNRPYYTDDHEKNGLRICGRELAIKFRHLQPNPPGITFRLVYDIDRVDAALAWEDAGVAPPNWVAMNPENGHVHIGYELAAPVVSTDIKHLRPLWYLDDIDAAYRDALGADQDYNRTTCKNPLHSHWRVAVYRSEPYELSELADYVALPGVSEQRRRPVEASASRNVTLFDHIRLWAYEHVAAFKNQGSGAFEQWRRAVSMKAFACNNVFDPLPWSEVEGIARSVARWTWRKYAGKLSDRKFLAHQAACGRSSGKARRNKRAPAVQKAQAMKAAGHSDAAIAACLGVDRSTAYRWTRQSDNPG